MKNITSILLISTLGFNFACTSMKNTENASQPLVNATLAENPFMKKSPLQYQAPEFDKIKDEHFKPAFDFGLKQNLEEIEKIANPQNLILVLSNGTCLGLWESEFVKNLKSE